MKNTIGSALTIVSAVFISLPAFGQLPTGGLVSSGTAGITTSGNTLTVGQSTASSIINWGTYNIGSANTVGIAPSQTQPSQAAYKST